MEFIKLEKEQLRLTGQMSATSMLSRLSTGTYWFWLRDMNVILQDFILYHYSTDLEGLFCPKGVVKARF